MNSQRWLTMNLRYWYDEQTEQIKIIGQDDSPVPLWTSVNLKDNSQRRHRNLYTKLYNRLKKAGKLPT